MKICSLTVAFLMVFLSVAAATEPDIIRYPRSASQNDRRFEYHISLLREALERTVDEFGAFELQPASIEMNQLRQFELLKSGSRVLDIAIKPTSTQREMELIPVRIPLDKGLLGWRLLLIDKNMQHQLAKIKRLEDLKRYRVGQGLGWNDIQIMKHNGLTVVEGSTYEGLFKMLMAGRFSIFPRGVGEALAEWDERHDDMPDLLVEQTLLIHYPFARYFWTANSPRGDLLRKRITKGLESMIANGTFDAMFRKYYDNDIRRAQMEKRTLIEMDNPNMPPETPVDRKELWFDPFR